MGGGGIFDFWIQKLEVPPYEMILCYVKSNQISTTSSINYFCTKTNLPVLIPTEKKTPKRLILRLYKNCVFFQFQSVETTTSGMLQAIANRVLRDMFQ